MCRKQLTNAIFINTDSKEMKPLCLSPETGYIFTFISKGFSWKWSGLNYLYLMSMQDSVGLLILIFNF